MVSNVSSIQRHEVDIAESRQTSVTSTGYISAVELGSKSFRPAIKSEEVVAGKSGEHKTADSIQGFRDLEDEVVALKLQLQAKDDEIVILSNELELSSTRERLLEAQLFGQSQANSDLPTTTSVSPSTEYHSHQCSTQNDMSTLREQHNKDMSALKLEFAELKYSMEDAKDGGKETARLQREVHELRNIIAGMKREFDASVVRARTSEHGISSWKDYFMAKIHELESNTLPRSIVEKVMAEHTRTL